MSIKKALKETGLKINNKEPEGKLISEKIKNIGDEYTAPTGKVELNDTTETDVSAYATAQVVDANLVPENIKKDVTILGVTGTYDPTTL